MEEEELTGLIDSFISEEGEREYLPLRERLRLRAELYNSFRKLDILQELVDDPGITEIMVNGPDSVFVEPGKNQKMGEDIREPGTAGGFDPADCEPCKQNGERIVTDCGCQTG